MNLYKFYTHVFIYMICENRYKDFLYIIILECSTLVPLCPFIRHPL